VNAVTASSRLWADGYRSMPAGASATVLSTDGGPSSGVSQSRCKSVYGTESHAAVNTPKRMEHNLIYAAVNLKREHNSSFLSLFCNPRW